MNFDPNWKPVAFKEWQIVCDAIASGEQTVILRKGGISEGKHGFQWIHDKFLLFPTLFHEQGNFVTPDSQGTPRKLENERSETDPVPFQLYVEAVQTGELSDWSEIQALSDYHIWTEQPIRERYEWGDTQGISFAVVKAWKFNTPLVLEHRKAFGGCRSWIGLPEDEVGFRRLMETAEEITPLKPFPIL